MTNVLLIGASGHMGKEVQQALENQSKLTLVAGFDRAGGENLSFPIYQDLQQIQEKIEVVIDFSHHSLTEAVLNFCLERKYPLVIATTGISDTLKEKIVAAGQQIPIFYSANFSLGINALIQALQKVTPILEEDFQIEIIEKHHSRKKDAPSGTALLLADSINEALTTKKEYIYGRSGTENTNPINEIGIHAVRGGTIPGEHTVLYAGEDEIIEFKHTALSRRIFANGAIKAAHFLAQQVPGFYEMSDLLQ